MADDDWPDWLPADWTVQIRKIDQRKVKCYVGPDGHKCYSKPQVFEYLKKINNGTSSEKNHNADGSPGNLPLEPDVPHANEVPQSLPQRQSARLTTGSGSKNYKEIDEIDDFPEPGASQRKSGVSKWLPDGWTVEVITVQSGARIGMRYKRYTDPISGKKFSSKPQVMKFLGITNSGVSGKREGDKSSTKPDKSHEYQATNVKKNRTEKKTESGRKYPDPEVISRTPADGLPPGWIKEIRLRYHGAVKKKDPLYLDPSSDYIFLSKLDALRYLDSGDVKKCAMRPLRRDVNEEHNAILTEGEVALQPDPSKGTETPEVLPNGSVRKGSGRRKNVRRIINEDGSLSTPDASQKDEASGWLPDGWVTEVNYHVSGRKIKYFKESASGKKFYSKPQVLNYIAGGSGRTSKKRKGGKSSIEYDSSGNSGRSNASRHKRSKKKTKNIENSSFKEDISTGPAEGLPPGWIREIRTRTYATHQRKDPFYMDPVSGFIFRSKLDAIRFLETGDITMCAIRPKKKDSDGNEIPIPEHEGQTPTNTTTRKLFEDEAENADSEIPENTSVSNTRTRGRPRKLTKSSATLPSRTSKRLKSADNNGGVNVENQVQGKQGSGVDLEKQVQETGTNMEKPGDNNNNNDDDQLSYDQLGDASWTDQCLDFAVKTLTGEIPVNKSQPESVANGNETPTKVN